MKKTRLSFLLLSLLLIAVGARADEITVNDGEATSSFVPVYGYYADAYTRSQFIIPAKDLVDASNSYITKMTFYSANSTVNWGNAKFKISLSEPAVESFASDESYAFKEDGLTEVFNGSLSVNNGVMVVDFDTPYQYGGGNLLVDFSEIETGTYNSVVWNGVNAEGGSVLGYSYSSLEAINNNANMGFSPKVTFEYDANVDTDCLKPVDFAVSDVTAHTATLSWTERGTSTSWKVLYMAKDDKEATEVVANENPFTLTGLEPETTYLVMIAPTCDEQKRTEVLQFTTTVACFAPEDVVVEPNSTSATIAWTGYSDYYNVQYREVPSFSFDFEEGNLCGWTAIRNGEGTSDTDWHVVKASNFFIGDVTLSAHSGEYVLLTRSYVWGQGAQHVDNWLISPQTTLDGTLSFWVYDDGAFHEHIDVYVSTTDNQISSFEMFAEVGDATNEWKQVTIDLSSLKGKTGYIALRHQDYDKDILFVDDISINLPGVSPEWTTINTNDESVEITDLSPNTKYEFQIQGVCEEADSKWVSGSFTTLEACPVPFDVAVEPSATTATVTWKGNSESYNVRYRKPGGIEQFFFEGFETGIPDTWTIIDNDGDGYNWISYNPSANGQTGLDNLGNPTVFDNACATSASYVSGLGALTPDNWLISPQLDLQGTLSVWLRGQDPSWAQENFAIYLSTTGKEVADFTTVLVPETTAAEIFTEYTADLSEYAGQKGYIAIRHFDCTDMFRLNVDNFALLGEPTDVSEWQTIATDETTAELTGLEPGTEYELQVQGVCDNQPTEWSNIVLFNTSFMLELLDDDLAQPAGSKNTDLIQANYGKLVSVMLKDRVFYKDGNWNSLCLPFNLTDEQIANSPLAGATIKKLSSAIVTGTHVDMTFTATDEISPNDVYIFKWNEQGEDITNPVFNDVTIDYSDYEGPILYASGYHFFAVGNYSTIVADPAKDEVYAYYLGADNKLRYSTQTVNLHTFRVFFNFYKNDIDPSAVQFNLNFDGEEATGIVEVDGVSKAAESTYNLQGVKINEPKQKGVYIQNGRKVVVK